MRADAVNMPKIGHPENFYWPSVQVNVATAERNDSGMKNYLFVLHNELTTKSNRPWLGRRDGYLRELSC